MVEVPDQMFQFHNGSIKRELITEDPSSECFNSTMVRLKAFTPIHMVDDTVSHSFNSTMVRLKAY